MDDLWDDLKQHASRDTLILYGIYDLSPRLAGILARDGDRVFPSRDVHHPAGTPWYVRVLHHAETRIFLRRVVRGLGLIGTLVLYAAAFLREVEAFLWVSPLVFATTMLSASPLVNLLGRRLGRSRTHLHPLTLRTEHHLLLTFVDARFEDARKVDASAAGELQCRILDLVAQRDALVVAAPAEQRIRVEIEALEAIDEELASKIEALAELGRSVRFPVWRPEVHVADEETRRATAERVLAESGARSELEGRLNA